MWQIQDVVDVVHHVKIMFSLGSKNMLVFEIPFIGYNLVSGVWSLESNCG